MGNVIREYVKEAIMNLEEENFCIEQVKYRLSVIYLLLNGLSIEKAELILKKLDMFSENKANKLVEGFDYLIGKSYYPYGDDGAEFKISKLFVKKQVIDVDFPNEVNLDILLDSEESSDIPNKNCKVYLEIVRGEEVYNIELEKALKRLKIKYNIDIIPN